MKQKGVFLVFLSTECYYSIEHAHRCPQDAQLCTAQRDGQKGRPLSTVSYSLHGSHLAGSIGSCSGSCGVLLAGFMMLSTHSRYDRRSAFTWSAEASPVGWSKTSHYKVSRTQANTPVSDLWGSTFKCRLHRQRCFCNYGRTPIIRIN
jgi:hypothetical protein